MAKKTAGAGCLFIFGIPFFAAGLFVIYLAISPIILNFKSKSWQVVQARVLEIELKTSRGSEGGTSYEAVGRYEYEFAGKTYQSDRLGLHSGGDNFTNYHQKMVSRLRAFKTENRTIPAYVDPNDPSEALIDRELDSKKLLFLTAFGLVFAGVGGGIMFGGLWSSRKAKKVKIKQESAPDEPWKWNEKWQENTIYSNKKTGFWVTLIVAIGLNAFLIPFWVGLSSDRSAPIFAYGIVGLFQLIGLAMIIAFFYQILRSMKYGKSSFSMEQIPAVIGGECRGLLHIPKRVEALQGFEVNLQCIHTYSTGSGDSRSTHHDVKWETGLQTVHPENKFDMEKTELQLSFQVPFESECEPTNPDKEIYWVLKVDADVEGIDYSEEFRLPFFITEDSNKDLRDTDVEHFGPELSLSDLTSALAERKIRLVEKEQGLMIFSPSWRKPFASFVFLVICLSLIVGSAVAFGKGVWGLGIILLVFSLVGSLIFHFTILTSRKVQISPNGVSLWINSPCYKSKISVPSEDVELAVKWDMKTNGQETSWSLRIQGQKKAHDLLTGIKDKDLLRQVELKIEEIVQGKTDDQA